VIRRRNSALKALPSMRTTAVLPGLDDSFRPLTTTRTARPRLPHRRRSGYKTTAANSIDRRWEQKSWNVAESAAA
jgi:hypothetical protein